MPAALGIMPLDDAQSARIPQGMNWLHDAFHLHGSETKVGTNNKPAMKMAGLISV